MSALLQYLPDRNPIHRVHQAVLDRLIAAQQNPLDSVFDSGAALYERVGQDLGLPLAVPDALREISAQAAADRPVRELSATFLSILRDSDIPAARAGAQATDLAQRTHLVRAFEKPDEVLAQVTEKVVEIARTFPREASDISRGRNPGDVLDPYILAATQTLLYGGSFQHAIAATVAHKALMVIEGLMGHLHEDVIAEMRGNVRAPEPRGRNQEIIDLHENPFPGADIVQPPTAPGEALRFHQVKSKTGSAKGGDGKRLGEQLNQLQQYYGGEVYYDALVGNTLRGHRSMRGVLSSEPKTVVLVGDAAFRQLTGSTIGPELLLRVYQNAFSEAASITGYRIGNMAAGIVSTFGERAHVAGEGYLELLLAGSIRSNAGEQDSRTYQPPSRRQP